MARSFNGTSDYLSYPDSTLLRQPTTAITVSLWHKIPASAGISYPGIIGKKTNSGSNPWQSWGISQTGASLGVYYGGISDGSTAGSKVDTSLTTALTSGVWYLFVLSWSQGGQVSLKVFNTDGTLNQEVYSVTSSITIGYDAGELFAMKNEGASYLGGDIAEVGIWDKKLSTAEINALSAGYSPSTVSTQNSIFHAPIIRGANDQHGALATITGSTVSAHPRVIYPNSNILIFPASAADTTAPTLTSPTGTATGSTTADGTVVTNEANGALKYLFSVNATESDAAILAGSSQPVTATGTQSVSTTGLTAATTYYVFYIHTDAAGNQSTQVRSASFTTNAAGTVYDAAVSLAGGVGDSYAAATNTQQTISMAIGLSTAQDNNVATDQAVSQAKGQSIGNAGANDTGSSTTLGIASTMATSSIITIEAAATLSVGDGIAASNVANLLASSGLKKTVYVAEDGSINTAATTGLAKGAGDNTVAGRSVQESLTLLIKGGTAQGALITIDGAVTFTNKTAISNNAIAIYESSVQIGRSLVMDIVGAAITGAGLDLSAIISINTVGTSISIGVKTPDGRVLYIESDIRLFSIEADNRVFGIGEDGRIFPIES